MTMIRLSLTISLALAALAPAAQAHNVRNHDGGALVTDRAIDGAMTLRAVDIARPTRPSASHASAPNGSGVCDATAVDWQGQPLPNGESGTLNPSAFFHSATINNDGRIAFVAKVDGADRNQGIFTADANGLQIVALGCGGDGGSGTPGSCGDPSPLGGTFSGFFISTFGTPAINGNGDVLFVADVDGGSSPRGLFLYHAGTGSIETVAAVGDDSPLGGTITILGMGSLNDDDTVAFLAVTGAAEESDILLWQNGVVSKYVAAGDAVPGGGTFTMLGTELWGFADGTSMAGGPIPSINDAGQIAFRGYVAGGESAGGFFLSSNGTHEWLVKAGDAAPGGATYIDFAAPILNNAGEIAFFADLSDAPSSAWFAGSAAGWRRVVAFGDTVDGATVDSVAFSRNPMNALADNGDVVVWVSRLMPDQNDRGTTMVVHPDGSHDILAVQGEDSPIGGIWGGSMDGWPSINDVGQVRMGSATPGFGDALSADVVFTLCNDDELFSDGFDGVAGTR